MRPAPSISISDGVVNWRFPVPDEPHVLTKLPATSSSCTRLLAESAIQMLPEASSARPFGLLNRPPLVPNEPFVITSACVLPLNFSIRWLLLSATYTKPLASTAIPEGRLNCPGVEPLLPHRSR